MQLLPPFSRVLPSQLGSHPLVVTADPELLDDVLRLAAVAGVEVEVAVDLAAARTRWSQPPVILVGADLGDAIAKAALRRREGVVMVSRDLDDAAVWKLAVETGADYVAVLPDAESWLIERLGAAAEPGGDALTIGVIGGRGGAGASTLAAALALTGARRSVPGRRCLLLDADPLGGGVDLIFGGEGVEGVRWPELAAARGRIGGASLRQALPRVGELAVLSFDRSDQLEVRADAMASVLSAARRGCDLVVIDLPRHLDDAAKVALARCDFALIVVPAEVRACSSAQRVAAEVLQVCGDVRAVVRGPAPGRLGAGDVSAALGLPLSGWLAPEPDLPLALERGEPPASSGKGPLARFCADLLSIELPADGAVSHSRDPAPEHHASNGSKGWVPG
jgi:secretion/DNA translocation related CpaE-like protein